MSNRYISLLLILILSIIEAKGQTIAVKIFSKLETDQDARITSPKTDQNGKKCAIIKVVTSQTGFGFDFGMIGNAVASEQKLGEIWVWVPAGARKITINHQQLGVLRNYPFDIDIEEATVYEMVLTTGKVVTTVEEQIGSEWLVINTEPNDAMVYLNDQFVKTGEYQSKLKPGSYTYRVESPLYHTEAGKVDIINTKKELNVKLKPAFGYLSVNTDPEQGAKVLVDGKLQTKTTPCNTEPLASGEHTVQVIKEMYQPAAQKLLVSDGQTTPVNLILKPNFAEIELAAPAGTTLYINSEQKGIGTWHGRLSAGVYSLEARKEKYRSAKQDIDVLAGDKRTVDLQPTPIYGSLDIVTTPSGALIMIEGKEYGTTPNTINKLLIGDYVVNMTKSGYASINKSVTIADRKSSEVNEMLLNGRAVTINSEPIGANLSIDGNRVGQTPFNGNLTFGNHSLSIEQGEKKAERTVTIAQTGGETTFALSFGLKSYTENVNGVNIEIVALKGGTYMMGSINENNEKPIHSVRISDFFIGKYEVTQDQWQAVMGINPSYFKGANFPVEQVSWNDVQIFLKKLNLLTLKTYRLPTEAEWEYAAKGGQQGQDFQYSGNNHILNVVSWYEDNSNKTTHKVGSKAPNELGIFDILGNVWEWCNDWYGEYINDQIIDPIGPPSGSKRILRGGSWDYSSLICRPELRNLVEPTYRHKGIGFRLALNNLK